MYCVSSEGTEFAFDGRLISNGLVTLLGSGVLEQRENQRERGDLS